MDSENSLATAEAHFGKLLNSRTIPALGGFRMLAVFSVVLAHAGYSGLFSARHGVSGFFVLSGFLITWLLLQEYETHKTVSLKHFFLRRAYRIFPAYYAFLAFSISMDLWRGNSDIEPLIWPGVFYLVNYYNAIEGHASASIAHAWSLAVEEQFYLIWPVLFLFLVRRGQAWLVAGLLGLILLVASWRSIAFSVLDLGPSYVYNAFDTRFDNLAVGCLLAVLLKRQLFQRIGTVLAWWAWTP
ncbi:MAG: acyltransferase, partial [Aquisalimonadaceae bacterium]